MSKTVEIDVQDYHALHDKAHRLAAIERQVIYRTEDIPEWAVAWEKVWPMTSQVAVCRWVISGGHTSQPAPDLRPDGHGPFFLPIIDAPDGEG